MACSIRVKPGNLRSRPSPSVRGGPARRHGNLPRRRCTRRSGGANLLNCNVVCHIPIETNSAAAAQREATMWSKARDLSTSRRVIHSFCGQTTPRWAYSRDMEPSPLSIQSKAPGSGVGKNPSQPLCNFRPCASRRTSHTPRSRTPIAPPIISAGQSVTANIDQNPPARHNHRRATPEEKHTKNALCGFSAGLTMKCEPSHRMVWYSTNHENRHFPTIPEAPQYPPRPHQPQNRIKSRGVVQPAANCRPPPPSPPQHGPKSPQSAIRRKYRFEGQSPVIASSAPEKAGPNDHAAPSTHRQCTRVRHTFDHLTQ